MIAAGPGPAGDTDRDAARRAVLLRHLSLRRVRTWQRLELDMAEGLLVLAGPNGVGKTNLLEAMAAACTGSSPRTSAELRLIREGESSARIAATVDVAGIEHERVLVLEHGRGKRLQVDGTTASSISAAASQAPVAVFLPERLLVMRGAPARRRARLDGLVSTLVADGEEVVRGLGRALQQRNSLLRRARAGADVRPAIEPWTAQVAELGTRLRAARASLLELLEAPMRERFAELTGMPDGALRLDLRGGEDIAASLEESWGMDVRRGSTTVGAHLDDLQAVAGSRDLRSHGSTGEQRAALLAWTLAEADVVTSQAGVRPLLLLDEPWSELDRARRRRLSEVLAAWPQAVVTSTEPPAHLAQVVPGADVRRVSSGQLQPWTDEPPTADDAPADDPDPNPGRTPT